MAIGNLARNTKYRSAFERSRRPNSTPNRPNPTSGGNPIQTVANKALGRESWEDTYDPNAWVTGDRPDWWGKDVSGTGLSQSYYDQYLKEQQNAINARVNSAVDANNAYIPQVNAQSDQALQNAYILREQNKVNAPQALSALGYSGGAAETNLMGIQTNYENTRNQVEQNRAQSLDDIRRNEQQIRATGDATLSEAAGDYYEKLITAQQQAERDAQAQENWQATYDLQEQQYKDAAEQQAWQNAYDEKLYELKKYDTYNSGKSKADDTSKTNAYFSTADRLLANLTIPTSKAALIKQYQADGRLSEQEAVTLLRKYGLM